jgi:hypothetical protein
MGCLGIAQILRYVHSYEVSVWRWRSAAAVARIATNEMRQI